MYFKVFCFFVVLSGAVAQDDHHHEETESSASVTHHIKYPIIQEYEGHYDEGHLGYHQHQYHAHPKYEFVYKIEDHHTGDIKSQHEARDGDAVEGFYTLHQPDGHERVVHYHGDLKNGFHANVKYGIHHHDMLKYHH